MHKPKSGVAQYYDVVGVSLSSYSSSCEIKNLGFFAEHAQEMSYWKETGHQDTGFSKKRRPIEQRAGFIFSTMSPTKHSAYCWTHSLYSLRTPFNTIIVPGYVLESRGIEGKKATCMRHNKGFRGMQNLARSIRGFDYILWRSSL